MISELTSPKRQAVPIVKKSRHRLGRLSPGQRVAAHLLLLLLCLPALLPLAWMVSTSLKPESQIFAKTGTSILQTLLPHPAQWSNYPAALRAIPIALYLDNTLLLCAFTVVGSVLSSALVAYGFGRLEFRGKTPLFLLMLATIALPAPVTMGPDLCLVPLAALVRNLPAADRAVVLRGTVLYLSADPVLPQAAR